MITVGSLFAGIGGLELGLEMTGGFKTVWQVENDKYATRVLEKHWPGVRRWGDVRTFPPDDGHDYRCNFICGGFPCQDISNIGQRAGIKGSRSGLWKEFVRVLRTIQPRYMLVENVAALLGRGMGDVLADLAQLGFDVGWQVLPASAVGARHLRRRVLIFGTARVLANSSGNAARCLVGYPPAVGRWLRLGEPDSGVGWLWPNKPSVGRRVYGVPARVDRLRCLGNAVVPQVARWIGERILNCEKDKMAQ